ncbi:unnamed protein product [Discula destructiva]
MSPSNDDMIYSTPSPSESNWSSSFSDCGNSETSSSTGWTGHDIDLPVTPPMPFATIANLYRFSVTSAPKTHKMSPTSSPTSPISTASVPSARGCSHAKEDDWMRHREHIIDLYLTQNKTLTEVMTSMKDLYDFKSTARIYKAWFKKWGCAKNVTAAAVDKLINKLDDCQHHALYADGSNKTTVLNVGDDLDVKRIQKYIRRKPVGLKKHRSDPRRPLDVIKALSVDKGKGRQGRAKVSISTVKLEHQQQQIPAPLILSQSDLMMPWSPRESTMPVEGLPDEMTRLIQTVVDQEFNMAYQYACSPLPLSPTPASQWKSLGAGDSQLIGSALPQLVDNFQAPDQMMLDFVLKFRIAHILLDDGLTVQAFEVVNICLSNLATRLQQTQGSDSWASGTVILYALSAALEMAISFTHLDVVHMLFQHIDNVCGEQQPRMAEIARRIPQLSRMQQIPMLKLARMMMSRAAVGYSGRENPSYEVYSRAVDIAISNESSSEKFRQLQVVLADPVVQSMPQMVVWMEERISLAVCDACLANQQGGFWNGNSPVAGGFPMWNQGDKISTVLNHSSERVDWHKMAGNWVTAERWASELAWLAELVHGYEHELSRKFRADIESVKSPMLEDSTMRSVLEPEEEVTSISGPMGVPMSPMHSLHASMSLPEMRGFKELDHAVSSPSWDQGHGQYHNSTLPSLWSATGGAMEGMSGVGVYSASASF